MSFKQVCNIFIIFVTQSSYRFRYWLASARLAQDSIACRLRTFYTQRFGHKRHDTLFKIAFLNYILTAHMVHIIPSLEYDSSWLEIKHAIFLKMTYVNWFIKLRYFEKKAKSLTKNCFILTASSARRLLFTYN